ncbi:MAG: hypothetical protein R3B06_03300 [Kofleriaceae bacterium]
MNLQRDPATGELFAIGKSGRPYTVAEVRGLIDGAAAGDPAAAASLIDVDLAVDRHGVRLSPDGLALAKRRARLGGWPPRASAHRRKRAWEQERALRQSWRSRVGPGRRSSAAPVRAATPCTGSPAPRLASGPAPTMMGPQLTASAPSEPSEARGRPRPAHADHGVDGSLDV